MCDYSLEHLLSRPAKVGDKLVTRNFGTGTCGFAEIGGDERVAVCLRPGTELAFEEPVTKSSYNWIGAPRWRDLGTVAIFRQTDMDKKAVHHDALEFVGGEIVKLTVFSPGKVATVLQLPAEPQAKPARVIEIVEHV